MQHLGDSLCAQEPSRFLRWGPSTCELVVDRALWIGALDGGKWMDEVTRSAYRAGVVGEGSGALGSGAAVVEQAGGQPGCEERASERQPGRHRTHGRAGDAAVRPIGPGGVGPVRCYHQRVW